MKEAIITYEENPEKTVEHMIIKWTELVRCKDCVYRGVSKKCVLAAISEEKNSPLFMLDNRGYWYCADGKRR